jgi:hypothetical protein
LFDLLYRQAESDKAGDESSVHSATSVGHYDTIKGQTFGVDREGQLKVGTVSFPKQSSGTPL